jgi:hypothetical protein
MDTGAIYWISEPNPLEEEVPDDLETSDRHIAIPHKNDLDLGSSSNLSRSMPSCRRVRASRPEPMSLAL